jgi:type II secretory pathway pseudopilin PulG
MKTNEDGFTLAETLPAIALILIAGGVMVMGSGAAVRGVSQSIKAVSTAATINRIDRHIRARADAVHIPYWSGTKPYIDTLTAGLYRSEFGAYIKSVKTIGNYPKAPRGIEVDYTVNNKDMRTVALFSSAAVMEETP